MTRFSKIRDRREFRAKREKNFLDSMVAYFHKTKSTSTVVETFQCEKRESWFRDSLRAQGIISSRQGRYLHVHRSWPDVLYLLRLKFYESHTR